MINEGVTAALAARDATRNGDDSHTLGTGKICYNVPCKKMLSHGGKLPTLRHYLLKLPISNAMEDTEKEDDEQILPWGEIKKL
ncbi:hypothetical protein Tco_1057315 [Tanacetum coccineum]|uniref:Uncharacterized protein n=1 Tax=Tanacetum coccineum TaxID=301880 RepID=A0ABQ5H750_9ASTR